ncbi:MAG TPA: hypothetical protein VN920_14210 [Pyrinomonadaceae bacterium]|nr:hypothetical protein [Pyrinomonadaceae bacterium]
MLVGAIEVVFRTLWAAFANFHTANLSPLSICAIVSKSEAANPTSGASTTLSPPFEPTITTRPNPADKKTERISLGALGELNTSC